MIEITPHTPSFATECDAPDGWTLTNATLTMDGDSAVKLAMTGALEASARRAMPMPESLRDFEVVARVRGSNGHKHSLQVLETGSLTRKYMVYLNYNCTINAVQAGTISFRRINNTGQVVNKVAATGVNTEEWVDLCIHFCAKNGSATLRLRQPDGTWKFGAQLASSWFAGDVVLTTLGSGAWMCCDCIQASLVNRIAIGDSICNGATTFSTVISANKNDGDNVWQRWCGSPEWERASAIGNKGVNGNTSAMVLARLQADVLDQQPKLVYLHACNNDYTQNVPLATRHANIQASLDLCVAAGVKVVLLNALYGTAARPTNPNERAYYEESWNTGLASWTGYDAALDITQPLQGPDGYQDPACTNATDHLHMNNGGAKAVGAYVKDC